MIAAWEVPVMSAARASIATFCFVFICLVSGRVVVLSGMFTHRGFWIRYRPWSGESVLVDFLQPGRPHGETAGTAVLRRLSYHGGSTLEGGIWVG